MDGLPKEVRLVTEPMSQVEIAEMVCIPLEMDEETYNCWMDALDASRLN
jgi:hypothetical protein